VAETFGRDFFASFPADFRWGVATAAYQIEGAAQEDGRGPSIWDTFSHTPGRTRDGDTGDIACDHYHRFPDDIRLMADGGIRHYRLSLSWPRLLPEGRGRVEPRGLAFYDRLVDTLLAHGIAPAVTLYHWDLPQALQDAGGWTNRDVAGWFADYAALAFARLGDRVGLWITQNEPWCTAYLGHVIGVHAPGLRDPGAGARAAHHVLLAHGRAVEAWRAAGHPGHIGITLNLNTVYPASDAEADRRAADLKDVLQNRWFLDPLFRGQYAERLADLDLDPAAFVEPGDLAVIGTPVDFLGVNYYSAEVVGATPDGRGWRDETPRTWVTDMGWPVMPEGLTDLLVRLHHDYTPVPLMVTENGMAARDVLDGEAVHDADRIRYLRLHIEAVAAALAQGVPVRGYYLWSLMDNFEWAEGYSKRFGAVYVDYPTQRRLPKDSWHWYGRVIDEHRQAHGGGGGR
jgi:beta-glucosidase